MGLPRCTQGLSNPATKLLHRHKPSTDISANIGGYKVC